MSRRRWPQARSAAKFATFTIAISVLILGAYTYFSGELPLTPAMTQRLRGQHTVADRLDQFGPAARARWQPFFQGAGVLYPPSEIVMLGLKQEKRLEIYARHDGDWKWIRALSIVKESGTLGPKLREGDRQVPEGFYALESLNPNSAYHLSLRVNYPNADDVIIGARDGRNGTDLGGDIMIHGGAASIGCLAMGDQNAEDLFVLSADAGRENVKIVLSPLDFRDAKLPVGDKRPGWLLERYAELEKFVKSLPKNSAPQSLTP